MCPRACPELVEGFAPVFWALTWAPVAKSKMWELDVTPVCAFPPPRYNDPTEFCFTRGLFMKTKFLALLCLVLALASASLAQTAAAPAPAPTPAPLTADERDAALKN